MTELLESVHVEADGRASLHRWARLCVYLQSWQIDKDVSVQSARSHQSIVQDVCPVRRSQDNDVVCRSHT